MTSHLLRGPVPRCRPTLPPQPRVSPFNSRRHRSLKPKSHFSVEHASEDPRRYSEARRRDRPDTLFPVDGKHYTVPLCTRQRDVEVKMQAALRRSPSCLLSPDAGRGKCGVRRSVNFLSVTLPPLSIYAISCHPFPRVLNLHSQASPVSRAPSMPPVETSYIPPPPPLIQDYRHYYHTPSDLPGRFLTWLKHTHTHTHTCWLVFQNDCSVPDDDLFPKI